MNVFKIAVYAIVAAAIIALILSFSPLFEKKEDPNNIILRMLEKAQFQTKLGKLTSQYIEFPKDTALRGELFDTKFRSVAFRCNSKLMCCEKNKKCGKIEWNEREIFIRNKTKMLTSARCSYAHGLFACSVYFGKKPAQLLIETKKEIEIDLNKKNSNKIKLKIKNVGSEKAFNVKITWKLYSLGKEKKYLEMEDFKILEFIDAESEKYEEIELPLEFLKNEKMELLIKAEANEAGYDKKNISLEIRNLQLERCKRTYAEGKKRLIEGMCVEKLFCEGCKYAVECEKVWEEKFLTNAESIHAATPEYAYREYHPTEICEEE